MSDARKPPLPKIKKQTRNTREYIIAKDSNCWVAAEVPVKIEQGAEAAIEIYDVHKFQVRKRVLLENSKVFKQMLQSSFANFKDAGQPMLKDANAGILEVVLSALHDSGSSEGLEEIDTKSLWLTISLCNQYQINPKLMKTWFIGWYKKHISSIDGCSSHSDSSSTECMAGSLLFPCYAFGHDVAFHEVTKHLVYNSRGYIHENNPTDKKYLGVPIGIIQQLNGARKRIRSRLEQTIYTPITDLISKATCPCRHRTALEYIAELHRLKLFPPLEVLAHQTALNAIIDKLDKFDYQPKHYEETCQHRKQDYDNLISKAVAKSRAYFSGLCLDCIAKTKETENPRDSKEFALCSTLKKWDPGCGLKHKESTWFFSYHARDEKR